jgi:hypothetical protein
MYRGSATHERNDVRAPRLSTGVSLAKEHLPHLFFKGSSSKATRSASFSPPVFGELTQFERSAPIMNTWTSSSLSLAFSEKYFRSLASIAKAMAVLVLPIPGGP